jgi:hypothetical protein
VACAIVVLGRYTQNRLRKQENSQRSDILPHWRSANRSKANDRFVRWLYLRSLANFLRLSRVLAMSGRVYRCAVGERAAPAIGDFTQLRVQMNDSLQPNPAPPSRRDLYVMPCAAEAFTGMVVGYGRSPVRLHFTLADGREFHLPISDIALRRLASALAALRPSQARIADAASCHGADQAVAADTPALPLK